MALVARTRWRRDRSTLPNIRVNRATRAGGGRDDRCSAHRFSRPSRRGGVAQDYNRQTGAPPPRVRARVLAAEAARPAAAEQRRAVRPGTPSALARTDDRATAWLRRLPGAHGERRRCLISVDSTIVRADSAACQVTRPGRTEFTASPGRRSIPRLPGLQGRMAYRRRRMRRDAWLGHGSPRCRRP